MQARALGRLAAITRHRGGNAVSAPVPRISGDALPAAMCAQTRCNSFIKQVMEQVKKDMEADDKLKKDWETAQATSKKLREKSDTLGERMSGVGEDLKSASAKTSELLSGWKEKIANNRSEARARFDKTMEENENLKKAHESMKEAGGSVSAGSQKVFSKAKDAFAGVMDSTSKAFSYFGDEHTRNTKLKEWKSHRDAAAATAAAKEAAAEAAAKEAAEKAEKEGPEAAAFDAAKDGASAEETAKAQAQAAAAAEPEAALVVSKHGNSSWDRFGAGLRDMPFLQNVFENPFFERVLGESEIAASIREMKEIDYSFHLEEFAEDIEHVVAPHIIKTYLEGDQDALEKHCGEAAFAAVNASIKSRKQQQLSLDTNILAGPKEVELKGAKLMDKGPPCFIWTFNMQQVNCLRDKHGEIIEGAVDDIRTVCYAMVVQRHPQLEKLDIEYPWQISELAILWNQPCF